MSRRSTSRAGSSISSCVDAARRRALVALCVVAATITAACGYQLGANGHGARFVSPLLAKISLEGMQRHAPLRVALKSALRVRGVRVVAAGASPARLILSGEEITRRPLAITGDAKAREYLVTASLEFSVRADGGRVLLAKQRVRSEGSYLYDDKRPSASESERRRTLRHVRRDLARRIVERLAALGARRGPNETRGGDIGAN